MFGIGPTEFIIIGVVALMLFSPRELPKILRSVAKFWGSLRNTADEFRDAIMNEEEMQDIRGVLRGGVADIKKAEAAARRELMKARMEMQKAQNKLLKTVKAAEESKREELAAAEAAAEAAAPSEAAAATDGAPAELAEPPAPANVAEPAADVVAHAAVAGAEAVARAAAVAAATTAGTGDAAPEGTVGRPGRSDIGQAS